MLGTYKHADTHTAHFTAHCMPHCMANCATCTCIAWHTLHFLPRLVVLVEVEAGQLVSQRGHECRVGAERRALLREDARPCGRSEYGSELSTSK